MNIPQENYFWWIRLVRTTICLLVLLISTIENIHSQSPKYLFFDFVKDSLKARSISCSAPANIQTFALSNAVVTDYVGNTRIALVTGIIASKKDTLLALHSLANGGGNLTLEAEWPFLAQKTRKVRKEDFIGLSLHPRISAIVSNTQTVEKSMISYDLGLNITGKITGDLGNIAVKYVIRNALCTGNNKFVANAFDFKENTFGYVSAQVKIRAGPNVFSLTYPLFIYAFDQRWVTHLPVYVGFSLLF